MQKNTVDKKERSSNIELFRIVLMLLIVVHHYTVNSGFLDMYDFDNITGNMVFLQIVSMFGKTIINAFTLISGYFMITSRVTVKRYLKVLLEVKFYYIVFFVIFAVTGYEPFSIKGLIKAIFPVIYDSGVGYIGTYLIFFLFIPVLNTLVSSLRKIYYEYLLVLLLVYFTLASSFFMHDTWSFLGWMMVMYLLGGYIRLYPNKLTESVKIAAWGTVSTILLMVISILVVDFVGVKFGFYTYDHLYSNCNKILAVLCAVFAFLFFKNIEIRHNKYINYIASSTFGILIIHAVSDTMRRFLWQDVFKNVEYYESSWLPLHMIAAVLLTYTVCLIIDKIRIALIEKRFFEWLDKLPVMEKIEQKWKEINS